MKNKLPFLLVVITLLAIPMQAAYAIDPVEWADGVVEVDGDILDAIATLLEADPPTEDTNIYAATDSYEISETSWLVSIVALDIEDPEDPWNLFTDGLWLGSALVTYSVTYEAEYYEPEWIGGGDATVYFPWEPGKKAMYGPFGVHTAWGLASVDFFGGENMGSDVFRYAYAATNGDITWYCDDGDQVTIRVHGPVGDMIYAHLQTGNTNLYNGGKVYARRSLGMLVAGDIQASECGYATQPNDQYHLHFGFESNGGGGDAFIVEGCFLTISTEIWQCGAGNLIGINGWLTAGSTPLPDDPTDPGDDPAYPDLGGGHVWDGIVGGLVDIVEVLIIAMLPNTIGLSSDVIYGMRTLVLNELSLANLLLPFVINFAIPLAVLGLILILEPIFIVIKLYLVVKRMIPVVG